MAVGQQAAGEIRQLRSKDNATPLYQPQLIMKYVPKLQQKKRR
jgi:hypothetical protein